MKTFFLYAILSNFCWIALIGQIPSETKRRSELSSRIDELIKQYVSKNLFSGSVLVAEKGQIIFDNHYGFQDLENLTPIHQETVFEIASLSKSFSAVLVLKLVQEGKLELDEPFSTFIPTFPYPNISIRQVLSHTSGLSERKFFSWAGKYMDPRKTYTNEVILDYLIEEQPALSFSPGESWEYSNLGYFLLPLLIEEITARPFLSYLKEEILIPLNMHQTGIYAQEYKGSRMDTYALGKLYQKEENRFHSAFGLATSDSIYGSVGMLSSTRDLLKWDRALYTEQILNQELLREAFTAVRLKDGSSSEYGLGWFVRGEEKSRGRRVDHYGLWPGYESSIVRYIDKDKTLIILSNQSPSAKDVLIEKISEMLFSKQVFNRNH